MGRQRRLLREVLRLLSLQAVLLLSGSELLLIALAIARGLMGDLLGACELACELIESAGRCGERTSIRVQHHPGQRRVPAERPLRVSLPASHSYLRALSDPLPLRGKPDRADAAAICGRLDLTRTALRDHEPK